MEGTSLVLSVTYSLAKECFVQGESEVVLPFCHLLYTYRNRGAYPTSGRRKIALGRRKIGTIWPSRRHSGPCAVTKSYIVQLLARPAHVLVLHTGPSTTMAWLSKRFYIPQVKRLLKSISRRCIVCQKTYAKNSSQLMADLPEVRVTSAHSFSLVGVGYAGPFLYKESNRRKPTICKGYVAIYVCLTTKAVFLNLLCDLTMDAFLTSLREFSSIYGVPTRISSDNSSNFVGAHLEFVRLKKLLHTTSTQQSLQQFSFDKDCQ